MGVEIVAKPIAIAEHEYIEECIGGVIKSECGNSGVLHSVILSPIAWKRYALEIGTVSAVERGAGSFVGLYGENVSRDFQLPYEEAWVVIRHG